MPAMLAAIQVKGAEAPCVIYWTGRVRLHVSVTTWCGGTHDASDNGVIQIPAEAKVCERCDDAIKTGIPKVPK